MAETHAPSSPPVGGEELHVTGGPAAGSSVRIGDELVIGRETVSYTHLTLPTTPYV